MINGGSIGGWWCWGKMRYSKEKNDEFYKAWPNKNLWFHTDGHCISYTFIFLPCMNGILWLIPHYFTCYNIKGQITEKLPIETTRIKFLSWLFFRTLKVDEDRDDSYWDQCHRLALTSQPSYTMQVLWERNERILYKVYKMDLHKESFQSDGREKLQIDET